MAMLHLVYKITNNINNKIYIGAHSTENKFDTYFGSGILISRAIKKYGKDNFTKEILFECSSIEEMFKVEKSLVNLDFVKRDDTYNLHIGGKGLAFGMVLCVDINGDKVYCTKDEFELNKNVTLFGIKHTEEAKERMKEARRLYLNSLTEEEFKLRHTGFKHSEESIKSRSDKQRGIKRGPSSEEAKIKQSIGLRNFWDSLTSEERKAMGRKQTDEIKNKISESSKKPKEKGICPHCNKVGGIGGLKRYHFDNCKFKELNNG